jgi:hypothetical protein
MTKKLITLAIAATFTASVQAGGLFGKGGLIRGDVGNFFDKHVEKPIVCFRQPCVDRDLRRITMNARRPASPQNHLIPA